MFKFFKEAVTQAAVTCIGGGLASTVLSKPAVKLYQAGAINAAFMLKALTTSVGPIFALQAYNYIKNHDPRRDEAHPDLRFLAFLYLCNLTISYMVDATVGREDIITNFLTTACFQALADSALEIGNNIRLSK